MINLGLIKLEGERFVIVDIENAKHINTSDNPDTKTRLDIYYSDQQNVVSPVANELTERQRLIFLQIEQNNYVTIDKMSQALGVTRRTIDRELSVLRKLGYIVEANKDNKSPLLVLKSI